MYCNTLEDSLVANDKNSVTYTIPPFISNVNDGVDTYVKRNPLSPVGALYTFEKFHKLYNIDFNIYIPDCVGFLTIFFKNEITDSTIKEQIERITMKW